MVLDCRISNTLEIHYDNLVKTLKIGKNSTQTLLNNIKVIFTTKYEFAKFGRLSSDNRPKDIM